MYMQVPAEVHGKCRGCVASDDFELCTKLRTDDEGNTDTDICKDGNAIFHEQTMVIEKEEKEETEKKTALALVGDLRNTWERLPAANVYCKLFNIQVAIEREQQVAYANRMELHALKHDLEKTNHTIENMQVALGKLKETEQSAIAMRPISELPFHIPKGCVILGVNASAKNMWACENDMQLIITNRKSATHFYIIPLPVANEPVANERKLHPCRIPGCGGEVVLEHNCYPNGDTKSYNVVCLKCGSTGPFCDTAEKAKDVWGYSELVN
jgi:hypothetical protein